MKIKKRSKSSRFRGSKTHARGFKKKARGSGHQGGVGMAGTGKRGDQKKTLILNLYGNDYFGKDRTLRRGNPVPKLSVINLQQIQDNIDSLTERGLAKENKGIYEINLSGYKILGLGKIDFKAKIKASAASDSAIKSLESNGSSLDLEEKAPEVQESKAPESTEPKKVEKKEKAVKSKK